MSNAEEYRKINEKLKNLRYAVAIIDFDGSTACPKNDFENSMQVSNYFKKEIMKITESDEYYHLLECLKEKREDLSDTEYMAVCKEQKRLERERKVPFALKEKGMDIISRNTANWMRGREKLDYSEFLTTLDEFVSYQRERISFLEGKYHGFDVLCDEMEDDFTTAEYDEFFDLLKKEILPLLKKILALPKRYDTSICNLRFDIDKQKKLTEKVCALMGYDRKNGYICETVHPFTLGINANDVRTTTSYSESLLFSNLYSVMHEVGHATYELQNEKEFSGTCLMGGASCALHESQSRLYENYFGRSRAFISYLYPVLCEEFPELSKYSEEDIYYYVNDVSNQTIRTEADELSYPFHILIRYEIEKKLISGEIRAKDVSKTFNDLMEEYLGVRPENDREGCFQDIHWTDSFGYFPTYAIGSAISAMCYDEMKKDFDFEADLRNGNFKNINAWLKSHIHHYGASLKNKEVLKKGLGLDFTPRNYVKYLQEKFTDLYDL